VSQMQIPGGSTDDTLRSETDSPRLRSIPLRAEFGQSHRSWRSPPKQSAYREPSWPAEEKPLSMPDTNSHGAQRHNEA